MAKSGKDIRAGRAYVELGVDDRISAGLRRAGARLKAFGESARKIGLGISGVGAAISAPFVAAAGVFAKVGDELTKASIRTGITVEALGGLKYAADQSGTSLETLEAGVRRLARVLNDAAGGSKEAEDTLRDLGVSVAELSKLPVDQQFKIIADRLLKIESASKRAALAQEVFGKSGTQLLPMLPEIETLAKRYEELGLTISTAAAGRATVFGDILSDIGKQMKQVAFVAGDFVAGALLPFLNGITKVLARVIAWVKENKVLVLSVAALGAGLVAAGAALIGVGVAATAAGYALGIVAGGITAIGAVVGGLVTPIGLVVSGIATLGAYFVTSSKAGQDALVALGTKFVELRAVATATFGGIADAMSGGKISLAASILWSGLQLEWLSGTQSLAKAWEDFRAGFVQTAAAAFYGALTIWANVQAGLQTAFAKTAGFFVETWRAAVEIVTGFFEDQFRASQKLAVDNEAANGKISRDEAEKRKQFIDQQFDAQRGIRKKQEVATAGQDQQALADRLAAIEQQRAQTVKDLNDAEMAISAAASANAESDKSELQKKIADLKQQLSDLNQQAAGQAQTTGMTPTSAPAMPDTEDIVAGVQRSIAARGTFSAASVQSLQTSGVEDTKLLREISRNTRLMRNNQPSFV